MNEKIAFPNIFPKGSLLLVAILLAFILAMTFIWLWYDLQLATLQSTVTGPDSLNSISINQTDNL